MGRTNLLFAMVLLCSTLGCRNTNAELNKMDKELVGKEMALGWPKLYVFKDSIVIDSFFQMTPIKIITYKDDKDCALCINQFLKNASLFLDYGNTYELFDANKVNYYAVVTRPIKEIQDCFQGEDIPFVTMIQDEKDLFITCNDLSNYNVLNMTFLVGRDNKIILVGDPIHNQDLRDKYVEEIVYLLKENDKP